MLVDLVAWDILRIANFIVGLTVVAYTVRILIVAKHPPQGWRWSMSALCAASLIIDFGAISALGRMPSIFTVLSSVVVMMSLIGAMQSSPRDFRPSTRPWDSLQHNLGENDGES